MKSAVPEAVTRGTEAMAVLISCSSRLSSCVSDSVVQTGYELVAKHSGMKSSIHYLKGCFKDNQLDKK